LETIAFFKGTCLNAWLNKVWSWDFDQ